MANLNFIVGVDPTKAKNGIDDINEKFKKLGKDVNGIFENISAERVISSLHQLNDIFGKIQQGLAQTHPQAAQFSGQLKEIGEWGAKGAELGKIFGPEGQLVGGIAGALIPVMKDLGQAWEGVNTKLNDFIDESDKMQQKMMHDNIPTLQHYIDLLVASATQENAQNQLQQRLQAGQGTVLEYQANYNRSLEQRRNAQARVNELESQAQNPEILRSYQDLYRVTHALEIARQQLAIATQNSTDAETALHRAQSQGGATVIEETGTMHAATDSERHRTGPSRAETLKQEQLAIAQKDREILEHQQQQAAAEIQVERQKEQTLEEIRNQADRQRIQHITAQQAAERDAAAIRQALRRQEEQRAQQELTRQTDLAKTNRQKLVDGVFGPLESSIGSFASGIGQAFTAVIEGKKSFDEAMKEMARSTLESLTQQSISQAIMETALGLAAIARAAFAYGGDPGAEASAAAHFASAATFAVIAGASGAGLAAMGPAPSTGGGSTSGPSNMNTSSPSGGSEGKGGIVVNINGGFSTSKEIGKAAYQALQQASMQNQIPQGALGKL